MPERDKRENPHTRRRQPIGTAVWDVKVAHDPEVVRPVPRASEAERSHHSACASVLDCDDVHDVNERFHQRCVDRIRKIVAERVCVARVEHSRALLAAYRATGLRSHIRLLHAQWELTLNDTRRNTVMLKLRCHASDPMKIVSAAQEKQAQDTPRITWVEVANAATTEYPRDEYGNRAAPVTLASE
ncbi:hypothetical protein BC826DRAFT_971253 [Russula brevipes]|nr:hypothetical protein BC826DRAFT_971253 [Russula brevipes]